MNIKFQDRLEQNQSFDSVLNNRATKLRLVGNGSPGFLLPFGYLDLTRNLRAAKASFSLYSGG
jgi:hypothetical protein